MRRNQLAANQKQLRKLLLLQQAFSGDATPRASTVSLPVQEAPAPAAEGPRPEAMPATLPRRRSTVATERPALGARAEPSETEGGAVRRASVSATAATTAAAVATTDAARATTTAAATTTTSPATTAAATTASPATTGATTTAGATTAAATPAEGTAGGSAGDPPGSAPPGGSGTTFSFPHSVSLSDTGAAPPAGAVTVPPRCVSAPVPPGTGSSTSLPAPERAKPRLETFLGDIQAQLMGPSGSSKASLAESK